MTNRYAIVIERGESGCSAFVPDLPGCIAAATTEAELRELIREAIEFHLEGMALNGESVPQPSTEFEYIDAQLPAA
ncbi:MAG: type II toxin-antitoxin system HicB family antitoxin [Acidobacteria bacterium]|nr:type II toxin-antitoxin system HicB family antitoxin [Acidobacteriota bacterium]